MDKICYTCKYFVPKRGKYGSGSCASFISRKKNKELVFKKDTCQSWQSKIK